MSEVREATIVSVDPTTKRAVVKLDYGGATGTTFIPDVRLNNFKGTKANGAMPEEGEPWLIMRTSESKQQWFLMQPRDYEGTSNVEVDPGDNGWSLPLGSRVMLRKNGTIELFSKPTCSLYMVPAEDLIQFHAVKFNMVTPQGALKWEPSVLTLVMGNDVGESSVVMKFGNTSEAFGAKDWGGGGNVYGSVTCGAFHMELDSAGSVSTEAQNLGISALGTAKVDIDGATTVKLKSTTDVETMDLNINTKTKVFWQVKTTLTIQASEIKLLAQRVVLTEEDGFVIDGIKLLNWLMSSFRVDPATGKLDPTALPGFIECLNFKVQV